MSPWKSFRTRHTYLPRVRAGACPRRGDCAVGKYGRRESRLRGTEVRRANTVISFVQEEIMIGTTYLIVQLP